MIDLSFLTDEEQETILKVLQRDAELKRSEEDRVRHLPEKVKDESQVKNMSGQWFYEAKSKRHRDKIHGADIIRASMRRKPLTIAEANQRKSNKGKNSWVNNVNKEAFMPPELFDVLEETEGEPKSLESPRGFNSASKVLDKPQEDSKKAAVSPSKLRKNPFDESTLLEDNIKNEQPESGVTALKKDILSPSVENQSKVNLTNNRAGDPTQAPVEPSELQSQAGKPPVPKARKYVNKASSDVDVQSEDSLPRAPRRVKQANGHGTPPRGILKRSSSSSSTDSEVLRLNQTLDPPSKIGLPSLTILEGVVEKSPSTEELEEFSQNSLERQKQVRFSSSIGQRERAQSVELQEGKEPGEFSLLDSDDVKASENQASGLDALQTLSPRPTSIHSPAFNDNAEDRGVAREGKKATDSSSANKSSLPFGTVQPEQSPSAQPVTSRESSSKIFPNIGKEKTVEQPRITIELPSPEPDISKGTPGQQLPLAKRKAPQVPNAGSADLEQGKPVLVEGQGAKIASKSDKHAAEVLKAADESISKVLDWFQRSTGDKETPLISQGREAAQKTDTPKSRELAGTREDNRSSTDTLSLYPFLESQELTSKDDPFHKSISKPGQFPVAQNVCQSDPVEEQRICSPSKEGEIADSNNEGWRVSDGARTLFQAADRGTKKADKSHLWREIAAEDQCKTELENDASREPNAFEVRKIQLNSNSVNSSGRVMDGERSILAYPEGEKSVVSSLEEGCIEHQTGAFPKKWEEKGSGFPHDGNNQNMNTGGENRLLMQQREFKQPSLIEDHKKIKDIRAFWEGEKTSRLENQEAPLKERPSVSKGMQWNKKEMGKIRQAGSSGYVTGDSDSEQGAYNLVTFKRVELSDEDSDSGETELTDTFKGEHVAGRLSKSLASDQKKIQLTELPDLDKLQSRSGPPFSSKEDEGLQAIALGKGRPSPAQQQKPNFQIHSLKGKLDDEAKAEMLPPSQFQSLRNFWDVGAKLQSRPGETKEKIAPSRDNTRTDHKALKEGIGLAVWEDEPPNRVTQEESMKDSSAKCVPQSSVKASSVILNQAGQLFAFPPVNIVPMENSKFGIPENSYPKKSVISELESRTVFPQREVGECVEKTLVPSSKRGLLNNGLQKLLIEASQESVPVCSQVDEKEDRKEDQNPQLGAVPADAARKAELPTKEVLETVSRTKAPHKADTDAYHAGLERLLKEGSDVTSFSSRPTPVDLSARAVSPIEKRRFFNKVVELSHEDNSSGQQGRPLVSQTEDAIAVVPSSADQPTEFKLGVEHLPRKLEDSASVPTRALNQKEVPKSLDNTPLREEIFQIPSTKPILPDVQTQSKSPVKEVSEAVIATNIASKRDCRDMNAKLVILLKESSKAHRILPTTGSIPKMPFDSIPQEELQRPSKLVTETTILSSPQGISPPKETLEEKFDQSAVAGEDDSGTFGATEGKPETASTVALPFANHSVEYLEGCTAASDQADDQVPEEVAEVVVKSVKPTQLEHMAFKASLNKLLQEASGIPLQDIERPKSIPVSSQSDQNESSVGRKDAPCPQEINEIIEKATAPSNSRYGDLKANIQKLLSEKSEALPSNQKSPAHTKEVQRTILIENEPSRTVNLVGQQDLAGPEEINETVNQMVAPSRVQPRDLNFGLQKLLEEASHLPSAQLKSLDGEKERMQASEGMVKMGSLPQEVEETVAKSVAPAKDDRALSSDLAKLIKESHGPPLPLYKEVSHDSATQLEKRRPPVKMAASDQSVSGGYHTEVEVPFRTVRQEEQAVEEASISGASKRNLDFQKVVEVNPASSESSFLEKGKDSPKSVRTTYESRSEIKAGMVSSARASLDDTSEMVDVPSGSQRASTPIAQNESPLKISKVELRLSTHHANEEEETADEDTGSVGSDLSDENLDSFMRIQRSSARPAEELDPIVEALRRSSNKQIPSQSLEDIPSATSNKGKVSIPKDGLMLSAEDDQILDQSHKTTENSPGISTASSFPDNQFANPEILKMKSKSVPAFLQDESDDRETDTASDSSYSLGRIKKSPSSLTNLSGSSGLASLSSVSTSVMSIYSGDFGSVDVKGNIQFAIDYVEQLKELHIFIAQCKDLAIADIKKQRSDPYVKSYLFPEKHKLGKRKTSVKKKTLNPVYNEILRYKVDKALLISQRLNLSVWHNDTFGRNSFLGEVELDLNTWDWNDKQNKQMNWYPLKPRTPLAALELENRGEMKLALQYVPLPIAGKKPSATGEVHIWVKECIDLPILRGTKLNSFVKCTILPDTSRKSRQKTRAVAKTTNPVFNHTMVYDGFESEDLKEACAELTVWDHNKLANHFLGGLRIGLGTGKSYGTAVDWMDSTLDEISLWERMINSPNKWVEDTLPLRMLMVAKITK